LTGGRKKKLRGRKKEQNLRPNMPIFWGGNLEGRGGKKERSLGGRWGERKGEGILAKNKR